MKDTLKWFEIAKPNPTLYDAQVQTGVHLEEILELLSDGLGFNNDLTYELDVWSGRLKRKEVLDFVDDMDKVAVLDSLCDQYVTLIGTARMLGMDIEAAIKEVEASNLSKYIYIGDREISPEELAQFAKDANDIEAQGRYNGVYWKRIGEYVVFYDENGKILKSPRTYFEPSLERFV